MTALWIALGCWFAVLTLFVAARVRATSRRQPPVRRQMHAAQLRALKAHGGQRPSLLAAGPRR